LIITCYFFSDDYIHKLTPEQLLKLDEVEREFIKIIETAQSGQNRLYQALEKAPSNFSIYVTHDGVVSKLIAESTGNKRASLVRGHYVQVEKKDNLNTWRVISSNDDNIEKVILH